MVYAAVMMYASWRVGICPARSGGFDSVGLYVFMNRRPMPTVIFFPGVAGMVVFIIFPLACDRHRAFTNYSGIQPALLEQATDYHLKKTYKVTGGEFRLCTLLGG